MATFQARVEAYTGSISDTDSLSSWLTSGARLVIDLLPEHILNEYAITVSVSTSGVYVYNYRIWKVLKNGYNAPIVDTGMMSALQDENSLHYAISSSPSAVIYNQKIYIYPNGGEFLGMEYPSVTYSDSSIQDFPSRMAHGVILYSAIQGLLYKSSSGLATVSSVSLPTAPSAPSFSFTSITGETVTLPTAPTYTKPTTTFSSTNLSSYVNSTTTEDLDQANAEAVHQKTLLEKFQMDLYNELNELNGELESYKGSLQKYVEDARMAQEAGLINSTKDLEASVSEYQSQLSKYQSEIQAYTNQISANVNLTQGYLMLVDKVKQEFNDFIQNSIRSNG